MSRSKKIDAGIADKQSTASATNFRRMVHLKETLIREFKGHCDGIVLVGSLATYDAAAFSSHVGDIDLILVADNIHMDSLFRKPSDSDIAVMTSVKEDVPYSLFLFHSNVFSAFCRLGMARLRLFRNMLKIGQDSDRVMRVAVDRDGSDVRYDIKCERVEGGVYVTYPTFATDLGIEPAFGVITSMLLSNPQILEDNTSKLDSSLKIFWLRVMQRLRSLHPPLSEQEFANSIFHFQDMSEKTQEAIRSTFRNYQTEALPL